MLREPTFGNWMTQARYCNSKQMQTRSSESQAGLTQTPCLDDQVGPGRDTNQQIVSLIS
jgi:hypothetical protein